MKGEKIEEVKVKYLWTVGGSCEEEIANRIGTALKVHWSSEIRSPGEKRAEQGNKDES